MNYNPEQMIRNRAWNMIQGAKDLRAHNNGLTRWTPQATNREEAIPTMVKIARESMHSANRIRRGESLETALTK